MRRAIGRGGSGGAKVPNFKHYHLNHEWMKKKNQSRHIQQYDHYHYPDYTPHYRQFNIHGNECRIIGSVPFDNSSAQVVLSVMQECSPNVVILGEKNRNDFEEMRQNREKFLNKPILYEGNDNLFAKKLYTRFFKNQMKSDLFYYMNEVDDTVYFADKINKRVLVDDYITAANTVHKTKDIGLLFGKPETTLHLEDIVLRFSLSELQNIFFKSVETTQSRFKDNNAYPFTDNQVIMTTLREVTKEQNKATLFGKVLAYQASLLKQCSRNYKTSLLITNNLFPEQVEQLTLEPALPEINEIFRTYLRTETKGKDLSTTVDEAWKKDLDKDKIKEIIELSKNRFNFRKEKVLYENIGNLNPEEVMEKFVILNHLIDNEMRLFLIEGQNPFANTIFAELFKDLSYDQLFGLYMSINMKYSMVLHDLQNSEIDRITTYTDVAGRRKLHTYNEAIQEVEERKEKLGYQYKTGFIQAVKQSIMVNHLIMQQIQKNIQRRVAEGRSQTEILLHLQKVKDGSANPRDYEVFKELMVEANAQLKLLKLPPTYRKYMSFIKEINVNIMEEMAQKSLGEITEEMVKAEMPFRKTVPTDVVQNSPVKKMSQKQRSNLIEKLSQLKEDENAVKRRQIFEKILPTNSETNEKISSESLINSMILGDDQPFPFDLNKMSIDELREHGAEILTDFNLKMKPEGGFEVVGADEEQKEKMRKLGEIIREANESREPDDWSDDEDAIHKTKMKY